MSGDNKLEIILAGKDATKKAFSSVQRSMTTLTKRVFSLQSAFVGLAGAAGMGALIKSSFTVVDGLAKTSDKLGVTTEALAGLRHAADLTGVSQEKLDSSLERMVKRLGEAKQGTGAAKKELELLGLSAKDLVKLKADQAFKIIADRVNNLGTQSERAAAAAAIFGREGVALVNTMKLGSKGLAEAADEAEKFGLAVSRVDAKKIEQANDAFTRAGGAIKGIGNVLAVDVAPAVEEAATQFANWVAANKELISQDVAAMLRAVGEAAKFAGEAFKKYLDWASGANLYKSQVSILEESIQKWEQLRKMYENVNTPGNAKFLETINRQLKLAKDKLDLLRETSAKAANDSNKLAREMESQAKALNKTNKALKESTQDYNAWSRELRWARTAVNDLNAGVTQSGDTYNDWSRKLRWALGDLKDFDKQTALAGDTYKDSWLKYDEGIDAAIVRGDKLLAQDLPDKITSGMDQALRNIQDIWGSTFEDLFTGSIRSFGDFFDEILDSFKRMLAQMTAEWVASGLMGLITGKGFSGFTGTGTVVGGLLDKITGGIGAVGAGKTLAGWLGIGGGAAAGTIGAAGGVGTAGTISAAGGVGAAGGTAGGFGGISGSLSAGLGAIAPAAAAGAIGAAYVSALNFGGELFGSLFNSHGPSGPTAWDIARDWAAGKKSSTKGGITVEFDPNSMKTFQEVTDGFKEAVSRYGMSVGRSESNYAEYDQTVDKMGSAFKSLGPDIEKKLINGGILLGNNIKDFMKLASIETGQKLKDDIINAGYNVSDALKNAISSSVVHYDGPMSIGYSGPSHIPGPVSRAAYEMGVGGPQRIAGGRALGGPVLPWKTYIVGEKGPELLHMGSQGGSVQPSSNINISLPISIAGRKVQTEIVKIVDGHIVERNVRGVDPSRRLV